MSDTDARPGTVAEAARAVIHSAEFHPSAPLRVSVDRDAFLALRLMLDNPEYRVRVVYDDEPYEFGDAEDEREDIVPLGVIVEYRYGSAEAWETSDSIWGVGCLESDRSLIGTGIVEDPGPGWPHAYTAADVREWLAEAPPESGLRHVAELARDMLPDHLL